MLAGSSETCLGGKRGTVWLRLCCNLEGEKGDERKWDACLRGCSGTEDIWEYMLGEGHRRNNRQTEQALETWREVKVIEGESRTSYQPDTHKTAQPYTTHL